MAEEESKHAEEEKKEKKCDCPQGAPLWMVTYSDLVTLLLTFFVLLLSMANMDPVRFLEASSSLKDAFGIHSVPANVEFAIPVIVSPPPTRFTPIEQQQTVQMYEKIKSQLQKMELAEDIELIQKDSDTIILRVDDTILFKPGQSKVSLKSYHIIRNIANIIRPLPIDLRVEGHTDDTPYSGSQMSNWDLSMARASSVMRFLNQSDLLELDRMSAVGYGEERPVASNDDAVNRAKNRRVDFMLKLKNATKKDFGKGAPGKVPL